MNYDQYTRPLIRQLAFKLHEVGIERTPREMFLFARAILRQNKMHSDSGPEILCGLLDLDLEILAHDLFAYEYELNNK